MRIAVDRAPHGGAVGKLWVRLPPRSAMVGAMASRELTQDVLLGPVFDALPVGVVVLDRAGLVLVFNKHEEQLAGRRRERVIGRSFFEEVAPCMNVRELGGEFFDKVESARLDLRVEFAIPFPHANQARDVVVVMQSVIVDNQPHAMLMIEDVSMRRAVERLKDSLATLLVHDFENPISVISSNLDFVRSLVREEPLAAALDDGMVATKQLHAMVLDLLDIARLETGTFTIARAETDVADLVRGVVRASAALARDAQVEVVADVALPVAAAIDASAIRRALGNLIENAIRYAPRDSRVVVSAAHEGREVVLRVVDHGPGVPASQRQAIFEKFTQGAAEGRTASNRGLGLTFVQMVARAHGGEVTVGDSVPRGSTFALRLLAS